MNPDPGHPSQVSNLYLDFATISVEEGDKVVDVLVKCILDFYHIHEGILFRLYIFYILTHGNDKATYGLICRVQKK